jgi:hypothetical protein
MEAMNESAISVELGGHIYSHREEKAINVLELMKPTSSRRRSIT